MTKRARQWGFLILALGVLGGVFGFNARHTQAPPHRGGPPGGSPSPPRGEAKTSTALPEVSVLRVVAATHPARMRAHGVVEPHYELTLAAQVSGRVEHLGESLASGQRVARDALLVQLEDTVYRGALAEARAALAEARLAYAQEQQQSQQARQEWRASGLSGKATDLVLRKPQLAVAQANVARAKAALATAELNLRHTQVRAPFDAVVISRAVTPGAYVQAGGAVARLYGTDWVEIPIYLSETEWTRLPPELDAGDTTWPVSLHSALSDHQWQGRVLRQTRHLDSETRLRGLILAVDDPLAREPPLLPGAFVKAEWQGRDIAGVWRLPASALSQQGEIWYVENGLLAKFSAQPLFSDATRIYIQPPADLADTPQSVLVTPLNAYVPGMRVKPVEIPWTGARHDPA